MSEWQTMRVDGGRLKALASQGPAITTRAQAL